MEDIREDCIAGFSLMAMFVLLLIAVVVSGCSKEAVAESADEQARFEVEYVGKGDSGPLMLDYMAVDVVTDTETGQQWVVVCTDNGTAMAPIEGE